jgi:type IV pilus assembly protein PilC
MRKLPDFFGTKEIAIIEAGEQTGMLKNVFLSISEDLRREEELKKKVGNAMTYPIIIFFFLILSMAIVMMYVIPQILPIIQNAGGEL